VPADRLREEQAEDELVLKEAVTVDAALAPARENGEENEERMLL
jgi:hypothetical protein